MSEQEKLSEHLNVLKNEHRELDGSISVLLQRTTPDMIQVQRLKRRKLQLKDEIAKVESTLLPNIIA